MPVLEERVIGIIIGRVLDEYRVDIGGAHVAMMSSIAFEGATQRNKPELKVCSAIKHILCSCIVLFVQMYCTGNAAV